MDASSGSSRCPQCGFQRPTGALVEAFDLHVSLGTRHYTLLNSNAPPDDSETTFIRAVVSDADARLASIDSEISKLQERLKQLEEERVLLSSYRTRNSAILSPLRRMPSEILCEIFSWTLPSIGEALITDHFDQTQSPWLVTRISSRWRAVSLSTPSLWSRIAIDYRQGLKGPSTYSYSLVEVQIQRAQNLKIHFYGCETADSGVQIQIFRLLLRHSPRWEEFSLGLTSSLVPLLPAVRDRIHSLKRVFIHWFSPESQKAVQSIDCFESACSLVDFNAYNEHRFIPIAHPTHQLRRYQLDCPWEIHKGILKLATNLVEARIVINFDDEPWPDMDEIVDLPLLRRLYVSYTAVLNYIRSPVLEEVAFWVEKGVDTFLPHLESLRDRSACSLRRICLKGFPDAYTTTEILEKHPSITELALLIITSDASIGTNLLISTLTASQALGSTTVAPQLRLLLFGCERHSSIDYTAYLEMLKSRWRAEDCALTAAVLATEVHGPDTATLLGLHALRREGLNFFLAEGIEAIDETDGWGYGTTW
ncbi:F-box domain-containing protein [Mycena venus]|uniref:F-box domain-containing protein n=1 Tax=Mycena venus TaxID=2733690 RepID=A0A8H6XRQ7_9AGAR|nr:F-box domain-containing protein [Mycena venus]